ncbi:TPA: hypothetical protein DF272_06730 [Candidatus Falkowbacteria bacterium]|nr:hypothetical protein [Candidatus Falkowbacteria bacterium]
MSNECDLEYLANWQPPTMDDILAEFRSINEDQVLPVLLALDPRTEVVFASLFDFDHREFAIMSAGEVVRLIRGEPVENPDFQRVLDWAAEVEKTPVDELDKPVPEDLADVLRRYCFWRVWPHLALTVVTTDAETWKNQTLAQATNWHHQQQARLNECLAEIKNEFNVQVADDSIFLFFDGCDRNVGREPMAQVKQLIDMSYENAVQKLDFTFRIFNFTFFGVIHGAQELVLDRQQAKYTELSRPPINASGEMSVVINFESTSDPPNTGR